LDFERFKARLRVYEGRMPGRYDDPRGIPTVGYGFNLTRDDAREKLAAAGADYDRVMAGEPLDEAQMEALLDGDAREAVAGARRVFPDFEGYTDDRQEVLADMIYNLGLTRFRGFRKLIAAVHACDWERAADEMIDSAWYRQVGRRSREHVARMRGQTAR
jgi:lysozyme